MQSHSAFDHNTVEQEQEVESYGQIAKSTGIFGGSQIVSIITGIIRTKILAVLLGSAGVGLAGLYQSVIELFKSVAGLGLGFSSVKDIAEAYQSGDENRIARTTTVLRKWVLWTGLAGMLLMIAFSNPASKYLFGNGSKVLPICILSFCVFIGIISSGQTALLQGKRKILKMAKASVFSSIGGVILAAFFYFWLGMDGIVPTLIAVTLLNFSLSYWFARSEYVKKIKMSFNEVLSGGKAMITLGFYSMVSGLVSTATMFLIKGFITKTGELGTLGLYQAVWSVSNLYLGAILNSMGADYYPRLCGLNGNDKAMVNFANEQTRFVLLVSTPVIICFMLFSSYILNLLYSSRFVDASRLMDWQILGTFLKVLIWPVAFFILAKGKGQMFFLVEFSWFLIYYVATRLLWGIYGLDSAGIAYLIAYIIYFPVVYFAVKPLCHFSFTRENKILILGFLSLTVAAFLISITLKGFLFWMLAAAIFSITSIISVRELNKVIPAKLWKEKLIRHFRKS